jgi:hypothetical protein
MGRSESDKAQVELRVFEQFVKLRGLTVVPGSIRKGTPPDEPDVCCELEGEGPAGFELAEACAPEFKAAVSSARHGGSAEAIWGADVSRTTLKNKLTKRYSVDFPIELVIYVGMTALPDDVLAPTLESSAQFNRGQFRRIWLLGDDAILLDQRED